MESLCFGLPNGFKLILEHTRALAFTQWPDYALLQSCIEDIRAMLPNADNTSFDWQRDYPSSATANVVIPPVTPKGCVRPHKQASPATVGCVPTRMYILNS